MTNSIVIIWIGIMTGYWSGGVWREYIETRQLALERIRA
jgi:hypothetical protein